MDWHKFQDLGVSRETFSKLEQYQVLLEKWNPKINLVSPSTLLESGNRHFLDSSQIFSLRNNDDKTWVDMGSGGGFPGLVVAILAAEHDPKMQVFCVESDLRKAAFLKTVAREVSIPVTVLSKRVENIDPLGANIISARALASLEQLFHMSLRHLNENGRCLFLKGQQHDKEIEEARKNWHFNCIKHPSKTQNGAVVLEVRDLKYAP